MKVLIVYHAGATDNARAIFAALAAHTGLELTVIAPQVLKVDAVYDPGGWLRVEREETANGYRLIPAPLRDPADYRHGFHRGPLRRILAELQPDIIHVFDELTSRYLHQIAWYRPHVASQSKVLFYAFNNLPVSPRRRLEGKLFWRLTDGGAAASTDAVENLRRDGYARNLPVERIFWGVSTDAFKPMDRRALRNQLGLGSAHYIGYVGRFIPEKGLAILQAALALVPEDIRCLLIGCGPLRDELELWSTSPAVRDRIRLVSPMPPDDLARHLNCMDALVLPSITTAHWKEQYGRVLAEAMACGTPVIGTNSGAIPEVIGSAGIVVAEQDSQALADAIRQVVFDHDTQQRLRDDGLKRAQQQLSAYAMAQRLVDLYERVV